MIEEGVVYTYLPTYRTIVPVHFLIKLQNPLKERRKTESHKVVCHGNFGPPKILVRGTKIPGKLVRRTIIF